MIEENVIYEITSYCLARVEEGDAEQLETATMMNHCLNSVARSNSQKQELPTQTSKVRNYYAPLASLLSKSASSLRWALK
jgi:hypothetical protein